ncbi:hypothetical protein ZHAS_00010117 [Anopheles sinensis]|uniref:Uncharacterized protein n=1 Tax=Anopheles sinensis TaxID=74873 RepID=A0A084VWS6_ANOSI|nr:hypothetical protein ZHAS_00010117 [Anopheles sinensis]
MDWVCVRTVGPVGPHWTPFGSSLPKGPNVLGTFQQTVYGFFAFAFVVIVAKAPSGHGDGELESGSVSGMLMTARKCIGKGKRCPSDGRVTGMS